MHTHTKLHKWCIVLYQRWSPHWLLGALASNNRYRLEWVCFECSVSRSPSVVICLLDNVQFLRNLLKWCFKMEANFLHYRYLGRTEGSIFYIHQKIHCKTLMLNSSYNVLQLYVISCNQNKKKLAFAHHYDFINNWACTICYRYTMYKLLPRYIRSSIAEDIPQLCLVL